MIKYIFSINTGRSGSHYLANILNQVEGVCAFHEPHPVMNGKPMKDFWRNNPFELENLTRKKIQFIKSKKNFSDLYVETNHTFIKGFGWILPLMVPQEEIGVIFLKRNKSEIVNSLYRMNCTPLTKLGREWLFNPLMKQPINKINLWFKIKFIIGVLTVRLIENKFNKKFFKLNKPNFIKSFEVQLLNWYVNEIYSKGQKFQEDFPGIKVFETSTYKLNDIHEYQKMFSFFNIGFHPNQKFLERLGQKTNIKPAINL